MNVHTTIYSQITVLSTEDSNRQIHVSLRQKIETKCSNVHILVLVNHCNECSTPWNII